MIWKRPFIDNIFKQTWANFFLHAAKLFHLILNNSI